MNGDERQQAPIDISEDTRKEQNRPTDIAERNTKKAPRKSPSEKAPRRVRHHSPEERADKLRRIGDSLGRGGISLKAAVAAVGISDQTYYQWKRAGKPAEASNALQLTALNPSLGNDLADFIKLEEENRRLRQILGEKLRTENAELRRRLEMD